MAFCRNCGAEVNDDVKFCPSCGAATGVSDKSGFDKKAEEFQKKAAELNNTEDTTADFDPDDIAKNKVYAVLAYFTILVLIPIFIAKDSKYARYHANQGLVLLLFEIVGSILVGIIAAISSTLGSVCSGGRYDNLLAHFGKSAAAIGFVLQVDDILEALNSQKIDLPAKDEPIVIEYDTNDSDGFAKAVAKADELRKTGKNVIVNHN